MRQWFDYYGGHWRLVRRGGEHRQRRQQRYRRQHWHGRQHQHGRVDRNGRHPRHRRHRQHGWQLRRKCGAWFRRSRRYRRRLRHRRDGWLGRPAGNRWFGHRRHRHRHRRIGHGYWRSRGDVRRNEDAGDGPDGRHHGRSDEDPSGGRRLRGGRRLAGLIVDGHADAALGPGQRDRAQPAPRRHRRHERLAQHHGRRGLCRRHGLREVQRQRMQGVGSALVAASQAAWAKVLAGFPAFYKSHGGVDLYALSAQNEPDFTASYQSCIFNSSQMVAWIKVLGPALAALSPPVKVLAAEPDNWGNIWGGDNFSTAILADSTADSFVGPMATHDYGGTSAGTYARPAPPANNTHHVWETECTPGDTGPITIATMIYAAFSTGGVNGWHYWWTQALVPNASSPPAQLYALGNFSKYVRPGYYRVDVSGAPKASGTVPLVVAFTNLSDGTVSIVVVNGGGAANVSFFVAGTAWPASVTPYVTTSSSKLAAGTAITVTGGRFSASLAGQSVTTFVGKP